MQVGGRAQRFFAAVVRRHVAGASLMADLGFQHLHGGQHSCLWRRRLCVQLRVAIGTQAVRRVHAAGGGVAGGVALRQGRAARDFDAVRGQQQDLMAALWVPPPSGAAAGVGLGGVGDGYGGDVARRGVLGDGFPRRCSQGPQ